MNNKTDYVDCQREARLVMSRCQWRSSSLNMKTSGKDIHYRRTEIIREGNEFLRELLEKRTYTCDIDDNGVIRRYQQFIRHRSNFDDHDDLLNEFDRRLHTLEHVPSTIYSKTFNHQNSNVIKTNLRHTTSIETHRTQPVSVENFIDTRQSSHSSRCLINPVLVNSYIEHSLSSRKTLNRLNIRRVDDSKSLDMDSTMSLERTTSSVLLLNRCFFPRSLINKKHRVLSTTSITQVSKSNIEQFDFDQVLQLLDQLVSTCSHDQFAAMLSQLTVTSHSQAQTHAKTDALLVNNADAIDNDDDDDDDDADDNSSQSTILYSNLFDLQYESHNYYTIQTIIIDQSNQLSVYPMTISTLQVNSGSIIPYSIVSGHRPVLQRSLTTKFKRIRSKRPVHTCHVTGVDSMTSHAEHLRENDIIYQVSIVTTCYSTMSNRIDSYYV
jgi:hypothetical protein